MLELLAPAGDRASLAAAVEAGASAVYFGLSTLNARRRAKNFRPEQFAEAVKTVHAHGARAYLTLNVDLAERDLGQAARILQLAREAGADAVLIRDPALLALKPHYPELEFHLSTQCCVANSADVAAAAQLGAARVVLAREMSLGEIAAAAAVPGVQTEVFVQGALCFSISGRCLLSSWIGGRSGNRGMCTSPCRVPWSVAGQAQGTPLSMRDLAALERLTQLRQAGVIALKIEGRLKTASWVRQAVSLYRRALAGEPLEPLLQEVEQLGAYTGRSLTCAYLDGQREELTGTSGREASPLTQEDWATADAAPAEATGTGGIDSATIDDATDAAEPTYELCIMLQSGSIACRCRCGQAVQQWSAPKTLVRRAHRAVSVGQVFAMLAERPIQGYRLGQADTDDPDFLLVPRTVNHLVDRISATIHQARKGPDQHVRIPLSPAVSQVLAHGKPHPANRRTLGEKPDRVRLELEDLDSFLAQAAPEGVIVEGLTKESLKRALKASRAVELVVALPSVFFEKDIPALKGLLSQCAAAGVTVEVNSWGGWHLARQAGVRMESGPGLPVLNSLAAVVLARHGIECVTLSPEADRRQLEDLAACCPVPCSLVVFGRPPLLTTRVRLSEKEMLGQVFEDRRGARMVPRLERDLWVFRPVEPFDLRDLANERIRVRHLVVDLVGSPDPLADWLNVPFADGHSQPFRFNYNRCLA